VAPVTAVRAVHGPELQLTSLGAAPRVRGQAWKLGHGGQAEP
jgi:hypothetical protein